MKFQTKRSAFVGLSHSFNVAKKALNNKRNLKKLIPRRVAVAILQNTSDEFDPTHILISVNDSKDIDLVKDATNQYLRIANPREGVKRVWNLPIVVSKQCPDGSALVGDFVNGTAEWESECLNSWPTG